MIKELIKKHNLFFKENRIILIQILLLTFTFLSFQLPFIFVEYLFWNYNWILFLIETISILLILNLLFNFYYSKTNKNLYDVFLNSNIKSKKQIILSKSMYIGIIVSAVCFFKSLLITFMLMYQFKNISFLFIFSISIIISELFFNLFFNLVNTLIYFKFGNKPFFIKLLYSMFFIIIFISIILKIIFSFYISTISSNYNNDFYKIANNKENFVYKSKSKNNYLVKYEIDVVSSFFVLPVYVFNDYMQKIYWDNNFKIDRKNKINLNTFGEDTKKEFKNESNNQNIHIYYLNSPSFIQKSDSYIVSYVKNKIFKNITISDFQGFTNKLEDTLWTKDNFDENECKSLRVLLGQNDYSILDFKRDWDRYLKLNSNLRKKLNSEFNFDISYLFDIIYSSEIAKINTSYKLFDFYTFDKLDSLNYDDLLPISKNDWLFIRNKMVKFDKESVNISLTYKKYKNIQSTLTIEKKEFLKLFPNVMSEKDWKDKIDNDQTLNKINLILEKINNLFHQKGLNLAYKLQSNILPYYNYYDLNRIEFNSRKNMDFSFAILYWFILTIFIMINLDKKRRNNE